jgi:hypothetical protein
VSARADGSTDRKAARILRLAPVLIVSVAAAWAIVLPRVECPPGYFTWNDGYSSAYCGLPPPLDDWGFDARENLPMRLSVFGVGLATAGAMLMLRDRRRIAGALVLVITCAAFVGIGRLRPPETLSQRAYRLASETPCPYRRCEGLSIERAIRSGLWTADVFNAYAIVGSGVSTGLDPRETRAYLDRMIADPAAFSTIPPHEDGNAGD